jgi:hypothetical protein
MRSSEGGHWKSTCIGNSLVAYPTSRSVLGEREAVIPPRRSTERHVMQQGELRIETTPIIHA